jgi:predicted TIM-barrel fold metal-dependent hydrolase
VPYLMDALDWHWKGYGAWKDHPMLPSEYFRRQCYGSLWFEHSTLNQLSAYPDNFMFESDYPHPTSLAPGAAMPKLMAKDYLRTTFADVGPELTRKVLHDNAARVYNLSV